MSHITQGGIAILEMYVAFIAFNALWWYVSDAMGPAIVEFYCTLVARDAR